MVHLRKVSMYSEFLTEMEYGYYSRYNEKIQQTLANMFTNNSKNQKVEAARTSHENHMNFYKKFNYRQPLKEVQSGIQCACVPRGKYFNPSLVQSFWADRYFGAFPLSRWNSYIEVSTFFAFERDMKNKTKGTVKKWKFQLNWRVLFTCCYYRNPVVVADVVSMVSQTIETGDWKSKLYMRSGPYFTMVLQV